MISRLLAGPALAFAQAKNAINAAALTELEPTFARELMPDRSAANTRPRAQRRSCNAAPQLHRFERVRPRTAGAARL